MAKTPNNPNAFAGPMADAYVALCPNSPFLASIMRLGGMSTQTPAEMVETTQSLQAASFLVAWDVPKISDLNMKSLEER